MKNSDILPQLCALLGIINTHKKQLHNEQPGPTVFYCGKTISKCISSKRKIIQQRNAVSNCISGKRKIIQQHNDVKTCRRMNAKFDTKTITFLHHPTNTPMSKVRITNAKFDRETITFFCIIQQQNDVKRCVEA